MIAIRELDTAETAFLQEMLRTALAWRPDVELPSKEWLLEHPQVAPFHRDWGREGDTALVAEADGTPVGLVWYRFFTEDDHGEGYVDEATPELAIAVADGFRGQGIGRQLMDEIHERARASGVARISLSVDAENPARRLYERLGYVEDEADEPTGRMALALA